MTRITKAVSLEMNGRWTGWRGPAIVSEEAPRGGFVLRNSCYKTIIASGRLGLQIGERINIRIIDAGTYCLFGELE